MRRLVGNVEAEGAIWRLLDHGGFSKSEGDRAETSAEIKTGSQGQEH